MEKNMEDRFKDLERVIGNTPLLELSFLYNGQPRTIYAKAEHYSMTGSIKDRIAYHILKRAFEKDLLKPKSTILEVTSGNTGIAFSAFGRSLGHEVIIFMPDWMSRERIHLMQSFGAQVQLVSKEDGGFVGSIKKAEELSKTLDRAFLPYQFSNTDNSEAHYLHTGPEIFEQLAEIGKLPDAFVAGVGTGGTVMGIGRYFKEKNPKVKVYPLEPANSPTLTTGHKVGFHRIQGISDEFIPPILDLASLDEIIQVDDGDSIIMAQKLAIELGLGIGISSGANFLGALKVQNELGPETVVTTVFSDDNKKYLSTDLMKVEQAENHFLSKDVELLSVKTFKSACTTCTRPYL